MILLLPLVLAVGPALVAQHNGGSFARWYVVGWLMWILAIVAALLLGG